MTRTYTLHDAVCFANDFNKSFFDTFELVDETNTGYVGVESNGKGYMITSELEDNLISEIVDHNGYFTYKMLCEKVSEMLNQGNADILPYDWFFNSNDSLKGYKIIDVYPYEYAGHAVISLTIKKVEA